MQINSIFYWTTLVFLVACGGQPEQCSPVRNTITETVFAAGSLVANDRYNLTAQTEGYIQSINAKEGDPVLIGQNIAVIDNSSTLAAATAAGEQLSIAQLNTQKNAPAIQEANAALSLAAQKMEQEEKNLNRYQNLYKTNSVSALELENATLAFETAKTNHAAAQQKLNQIKQQAEWTLAAQKAQHVSQSNSAGFNQVKALAQGTVIKVIKKVGDFVKKGDVIATLASNKKIVAQLNVDENSIQKVKPGQSAHIQLNVEKGKVLEGVVSTIYPLYDEASQSFLCDVVLKDSLAFQILGTRLEANIDIITRENVLLIPRKWLSYQNTVQLKGKKDPRPVVVGIRSNDWVEVVDGLTESDVLVPLKK
jgi:multidrug resistance efflux pump